jgi:hypothetical protein
VGELLKALLTHPDSRYPLAQKGIHHLQPQGAATPMPSTDYAERMMICAAQLQYAVTFGDNMPTEDDPGMVAGMVHEVNFSESAPVLAGGLPAGDVSLEPARGAEQPAGGGLVSKFRVALGGKTGCR